MATTEQPNTELPGYHELDNFNFHDTGINALLVGAGGGQPWAPMFVAHQMHADYGCMNYGEGISPAHTADVVESQADFMSSMHLPGLDNDWETRFNATLPTPQNTNLWQGAIDTPIMAVAPYSSAAMDAHASMSTTSTDWMNVNGDRAGKHTPSPKPDRLSESVPESHLAEKKRKNQNKHQTAKKTKPTGATSPPLSTPTSSSSSSPKVRPANQEDCRQAHSVGKESFITVLANSEPVRPRSQRDRNRRAATKCRAKTKAAVLDLEQSEQKEADLRSYLHGVRDELRSQVISLRGQILLHSDCDCETIKEYIKNSAGTIARTGGRLPVMGVDGCGAQWTEMQDESNESVRSPEGE